MNDCQNDTCVENNTWERNTREHKTLFPLSFSQSLALKLHMMQRLWDCCKTHKKDTKKQDEEREVEHMKKKRKSFCTVGWEK